MDIIKKHYEKFILGFLLLSFVMALVYLLQIMGSSQDSNSGNRTIAKNTLVIMRENQVYEFKYKKENFSVPQQSGELVWQERKGEGLIGYGRPGLAVPMKLLRCSQCKKIVPWSQLRKNDMRCPFEACSQDLRDPGEPEDYENKIANFDSDGDGMPDRYEIRFGLNCNSADDADQDKDGDSYSNWFEYYCRTNPDDAKSIPSIDKMMFVSKIEAVKLPLKLNRIIARNPKDKKSYKIYLAINNRDKQNDIGDTLELSGKRYKIVDAEKRSTTEQRTSYAQQEDDSLIWLMPEGSTNAADRIEVRARKDVFDNKTRHVAVNDVRTPNKRRSKLTVGSEFKFKNNTDSKGTVTFKITAVDEKSVEFEYILNTTQKMTLELVERNSDLHKHLKKAYVKSDANKTDNKLPEEAPQPKRRSGSSRRR